jgi:tetratricopeptide (TPR) repeat protein
VGEIQEKLGHYSEADSACHRATRILQRLVADVPSFPQYECELATTEGTLARLSWATGPHGKAERLVRQAIARLEMLVTDVPSDPRYRNELARSYMLLAQFLSKTARWEAEKAILQAIPLFEKLAADSIGMPRYRHELVVAHASLGLVLRDLGRYEDARRTYRRAITLGEELVSESPSVPEYVSALALSLDALAQLTLAQLRGAPNYSSETEQLYRQAIKLEEKLAADSPSVPSYRLRLALTRNYLAIFLGNAGRWQEAEQVNRQAIALLEKLTADLPSAI